MDLGKLIIRTDDDPCLRKKSTPVKDIGLAERLLAESMLETMYANKGVGLAAPQVGVNQQIFVMDAGDGPIAIFNPQILKKAGAQCREEGCLSLPGQVVNVKRAKKIFVTYLDQHRRPVKKELADLPARVFLHEHDHLHGKLISDYRGLREKLGLKRRTAKRPASDKPGKGKAI